MQTKTPKVYAGTWLATALLTFVASIVFMVELFESDALGFDGEASEEFGEAPGSGVDCDFTDGCESDFSAGLDIGQIDGAPGWVNGFFAFIMGLLLAAGLILFIAGLIGVPLGGG